ncbi:MAG: serine/threonine protein kinase, partial [bacterium]
SFTPRVNGKAIPTINSCMGTPGYQPPEFCSNSDSMEVITEQCDIFSMGATLYHVLTGQQPKTTPEGIAVFEQKLIDTLPEQWKLWLKTALAEKPKDRFQNFDDAIKAAHSLETKG